MTGQDRAQDDSGEDEDDGDRVARLSLRVDLSNPSRQGKYAVTSDGEHQT